MDNLKKSAIEEVNNNFKRWKDKINTEEGLKEVLGFFGKKYKNNVKEKALKLLENEQVKRIKEVLTEIKEIEEADDFSGDLVLTIEWRKSRMWGYNPKGYDNFGRESESIGGCGYDKKSTATAQLLNQDKRLLKLLCLAKDKAIKEHGNEKIKLNYNGEKIPKAEQREKSTSDLNREFLGYGSGYEVIPKFEGGVGVSCHERIINGLGLRWECVASTDNTDVYLIGVKK